MPVAVGFVLLLAKISTVDMNCLCCSCQCCLCIVHWHCVFIGSAIVVRMECLTSTTELTHTTTIFELKVDFKV